MTVALSLYCLWKLRPAASTITTVLKITWDTIVVLVRLILTCGTALASVAISAAAYAIGQISHSQGALVVASEYFQGSQSTMRLAGILSLLSPNRPTASPTGSSIASTTITAIAQTAGRGNVVRTLVTSAGLHVLYTLLSNPDTFGPLFGLFTSFFSGQTAAPNAPSGSN